MALTEKIVRSELPTGCTRIVWDERLKGLGLRISQGGTKAYVLQYRDADGRSRRVTLGRVDSMNLKEVRALAARELAGLADRLTDPFERTKAVNAASTVNHALDVFFQTYIPQRVRRGRMSPNTVANYRAWSRRLLIAIGRRRVSEVQRRDLEEIAAELPAVTGNRVLQFASTFFNWLEREDARPAASNPVNGVERARETPRDRVLSPAELQSLKAALNAAGTTNRAQVAAIGVAMLSGLRIGEIIGIRWVDIDLETGRLIIRDSKTGRRDHWLPPIAVDMLNGLDRIAEWCFAVRADTPPAYKSIRLCFQRAVNAAGLRDVRLHDLRRTVLTTGAGIGLSTHQLRAISGHTSTRMLDRYVQLSGAMANDGRERVASAIAGYING